MAILDKSAVSLQIIRMWIKRKYEHTLALMVEQFPAVVVTGARQVGKTSLVRKVLLEFGFASLDLPAVAEQAESSPEAFLDEDPPPLIIDEIQYANSLFRYLKVRLDADRRPGKYVLTGSQNFPLTELPDLVPNREYAAAWKPRHARPGWSGYHRHALSHTSAMSQACQSVDFSDHSAKTGRKFQFDKFFGIKYKIGL